MSERIVTLNEEVIKGQIKVYAGTSVIFQCRLVD